MSMTGCLQRKEIDQSEFSRKRLSQYASLAKKVVGYNSHCSASEPCTHGSLWSEPSSCTTAVLKSNEHPNDT